MDYRIFPPEKILEANVSLPQSKSIAARAIILDYLSGRVNTQTWCDDTDTIARILRKDLPDDGSTIDVGPAGTAYRFLCALCSASEGTECVLSGSERMLHRPIKPLVDALRALGADIEYIGEEGLPPLKIKGRKLSGGTIDIDATTSSQFVSALMLTAPLMIAPLTIRLVGNVQSMPYIRMTAEMMRARGVSIEYDRDKIEISHASVLSASSENIEPDWSAAAFWYEIAALTAGWVTIKGLKKESLQGDRMMTELFERLGVISEFTEDGVELSATPDLYSLLDADLTDMPDAVPALVVTCCLAGIRFRLTGIGALHHKECDRIEALISEMAKLGCILDTENYGTTLVWDGRRVPVTQLPVFDTYSDHRMAMALAPVSVFVPGIVVKDIEVVSKSYPEYWAQLEEAGFILSDACTPLPDTENED